MRGKGEGSLYKDSRGLWTATVELPQRDGKRRRKTIRSRDKATAQRKLAELNKLLGSNGDIHTKSMSVEQWFDYWLTEIIGRERKPKTVAGYTSVVRNQIVPALGPKLPVSKVTPSRIRAVHDAIIGSGLTHGYALNAHRVMASAFETAFREGRIDKNPVKMINPPKQPPAALQALSVTEAVQLLEHVSNDPQMGARWAMGLLTGARRGEVIGLELNRVGDYLDLSWQLQSLATVSPGIPKAAADFEYRHLTGSLFLTRPKSLSGWRMVPLVDPLRSILERHIAASEPNPWGLVFTSNGKPIQPTSDSHRWQSVLAAAGIDKQIRLHDLRHTAVDLLYLAGVPEDIISELVGHSKVSMTRGYKAKGNQERLQKAMLDMSELLNRRGGSRSTTSASIAS